MIRCDEIIDAETKTIPLNFNEKKSYEAESYVTYLFINYSCIIDTCEYSLLFDEISGEKNIY